MPSRARLLLLALLATARAASQAGAVSIPILDPGFDVFKTGTLELIDDHEIDLFNGQFLPDGSGPQVNVPLSTGFGFTTGNFADVPAGWTATGMSPGIPPAPSTARIRVDAAFRHPTGTVASINSNGSGQFMQTLTGVTLRPNMVYTLSIDVLDRDSTANYGADLVGLGSADMIDIALYAGSLDANLGGVKSFVPPANGETSTLTRTITTEPDVSATPGELMIAFTAGGVAAHDLAITWQTYFDNVRLDAAPIGPAFSADFDDNGGVNAVDLEVWRGAFGLTQLGDADGDLDSDGVDLLAWQRQLGAPSAAATAVPEPRAATLATILGVATSRCLRRRRGRDLIK